MKIRRIISVFLLSVLLTGLFLTPQAAAAAKEAKPPKVKAEAALLVDTDNDVILFDKNAHQKMYPASITKVMTALLVSEAIDRGDLKLQQKITVSSNSLLGLDPDGSSAGIEAGEVLTVEQLLYCMLLVSANEACHILAETVDGSVDKFVQHMNQRAKELGCEGTHFVNPSGLHSNDHYTTAWDIYLIAREFMKHDTLMKICNSVSYVVPATNKSEERELHTTNSLISNWRILGYLYDGAQGIKTGTTPEAGHCLVSSASRNGRQMVCVVLGCEGEGDTIESFSETAKLYDYGFDKFTVQTIIQADEMVKEVPVALSKETDRVVVHPAEDVSSVLPNNVDLEKVERKVTLKNETALAPIKKGDVLGELTITYDGQVRAKVPLLAQYDVSASRFLTVEYQIKQFFSRTIVQVLLVLVALAAIALFIWCKFFRRNRRYGSNRLSRRNRGRRAYRGHRR